MKSSILAITLITATTLGVYAGPTVKSSVTAVHQTPVPLNHLPLQEERQSITEIKQRKIEVVFVLDTTGSMSGLIQGAKDNIWSIASSMASANSAPVIEMGLVAYRDRGDQYVTQVVDLSDDLDTNYGKLMAFEADGGGDSPESVNKGLYDAVNKISWSQDSETYRVIFLVGDAPPHTDYQDEMQFPEIVELASSKGIIINTIQCGNNHGTAAPWKQIASLGLGQFFQVEQGGGAVAISTPYDEQIAAFSKELDETRLFYGDKEVKERKQKKRAATDLFNRSASAASIARKAEFNTSKSGKRNFVGENELVDAITSGAVTLDSIDSKQLPKELQALDQTEQATLIKDKAQKRQELELKISELAKKRSSYVKQELEKTKADEGSLDKKIYEAVKSQASTKGLVYEDDAPKY